MSDFQDPDQSGPGLTVVGGATDGAVLELTVGIREYRLGSAPDCDLHVDLGNVDAIHARLAIDGLRLLLSDAGSGTGTYVNGEKIGPLHELHDGDRISLGPPGSKGSARLLVALPEGSFTSSAAKPSQKTKGSDRAGSDSGEATGLAPLPASGGREQGPWSLMPPGESGGGLELSSPAGEGFFPSLSPSPHVGSQDASSNDFGAGSGLELSGSAGDSLFPSLPPLGAAEKQPGATSTESWGLEVSTSAGSLALPSTTPSPGSLAPVGASDPYSFGTILPNEEEPSSSGVDTGSDLVLPALDDGRSDGFGSSSMPTVPGPAASGPTYLTPSTPLSSELQPARRVVPPLPPLPDSIPVPPPVPPGSSRAVLSPSPAPQSPPSTRPEPSRRTAPEYSSELPSIGWESPHGTEGLPEVSPAPPPRPATAPRRAARRGGRGFSISSFSLSPGLKIALLAIVVACAAAGGFLALRPLFNRPPTVESTSPGRVQVGQTLMITGTGFDPVPSRNTVRIGAAVGSITSATGTQLAVTVPKSAVTQEHRDVDVIVSNAAGSAKPIKVQVVLSPRLGGVEPDVVMPGDELTIRGEDLDGKGRMVSFSGTPGEVREASATSLKVIVPALPYAPGAKVRVTVTVDSETTKPADILLGRLPLLLALEPPRGFAGDRVRARGRGFDANSTNNTVSLGNQAALVLSASPTEITFVVPGSSTGFSEEAVPVQIVSNGTASTNPAKFIIGRAAASSFLPRFFAGATPAAAGPGTAFVSCELGPLFPIAAKGEDASAADRAVRIAGELNALVEQALVKRVTLELQEKPGPGVAVTGSQKQLLTVHPEDAALYSKALVEGSPKGRVVTPRAVAALWTALLQDSLSLFVYRERPLRMLEYSSKARLFTDLYAEALRLTGRGGGVPVRLVLPAPSTLSRSFREVALVPSADGGARPGVAIEGRWEGTVEVDSSRPIQLRLRLDGNRIVGTMSAQSGKLQMNTPIKDVTYEKGTLRFVVEMVGAPRLFVGSVSADTITGTVQRAGGDNARLGTFTLRYAE